MGGWGGGGGVKDFVSKRINEIVVEEAVLRWVEAGQGTDF